MLVQLGPFWLVMMRLIERAARATAHIKLHRFLRATSEKCGLVEMLRDSG